MLAIHHKKNSFSDKWIEYCTLNNIAYKLVDSYSTSIMKDLQGCQAFMWHWYHYDHKAQLFARQLIVSIERMGIKVFPDSNTCWHFDDKLGQKYLFESINAPFIKSYLFYDLDTALLWIKKSDFPKVFKLRGGAGSENVKLLKNKKEAKKYAKESFSKGFKVSKTAALKERIWAFKREKTFISFLNIAKGIGRILFPSKLKAGLPIEKNYLYIQDFIPNNDSDIRIITIGKKAFAIKRMVREGDFRASGSGNIIYDPSVIPKECIEIAFETSEKLQTQCAAYDFVFLGNRPLIIEISYSFSQKGYLSCIGYWDEKLNWIDGAFSPEFFMIENLLDSLKLDFKNNA